MHNPFAALSASIPPVAMQSYVGVMFTDVLGWIMLGMAVVMLCVGIFWMSKVAKVDL